jgi:hypothetical protein
MKIKTVLTERMAPVLEKYGYNMKVKGRLNYVFSTKNNYRVIDIDTHSPFLNTLRFDYYANGKNSLILSLHNFNAEFCYASQLRYSNHEELEHYIDEVTRATVAIINPYLDIMEENYVSSTFEMYKKLSENTSSRAQEFADKWHLSMEPEHENLKKLNSIMNGMKKNISRRKEEFLENEEEIINLCAYYGELITIHEELPGRWMWIDITETLKNFVVETRGYNPLSRTLSAWNFGSEGDFYGFKSF